MCEWPCANVEHNATVLEGPSELTVNSVRTDLFFVVLAYNVTTIKSFVFSGWSQLVSVVLPSTLKEILSYAFYQCINLKSIEFPVATTTIGDFSFAGCLDLHTVTFVTGSLLESIGRSAFENCEQLAFRLPVVLEKLTIGPSAFYNMKCCIKSDCLLDPFCAATNKLTDSSGFWAFFLILPLACVVMYKYKKQPAVMVGEFDSDDSSTSSTSIGATTTYPMYDVSSATVWTDQLYEEGLYCYGTTTLYDNKTVPNTDVAKYEIPRSEGYLEI